MTNKYKAIDLQLHADLVEKLKRGVYLLRRSLNSERVLAGDIRPVLGFLLAGHATGKIAEPK